MTEQQVLEVMFEYLRNYLEVVVCMESHTSGEKFVRVEFSLRNPRTAKSELLSSDYDRS